MRKHFGIVLAILAFAALVAAGGYRLAAVNESTIDNALGEGFTASNRLVNTATPWFSVRLDDGRDDQYDIAGDPDALGVAYAFLAYEVPISLALNYNNLDQAGFLTTAEVQQIIDDFNAAGVPIEIVQHTDGNYSEGDAMTYEELVDHIDPSELEAAFGVDVITMAQPGDALDFMYENRSAIMYIADSVGIKYADLGYGTEEYNPHSMWAINDVLDILVNPQSDTRAKKALWPGVSQDPLWMPAAYTADIGNLVVERPAVATGDYQYTGFTVLADRTGNDPVADWDKTWRTEQAVFMSQNWGVVWALHDSINGSVTNAGEFSYIHMAKTLDAMRDAGFLNLGTCRQTYEWATSRYAPGTDLIGNMTAEIPIYVVGDTIGVELGFVPGFGSKGALGGSWAFSHGAGTWVNGTNAKFARQAGHPELETGAAVTDGYRGRDGGLQVDTPQNSVRVFRSQLPEGWYEFRLFNSTDDLELREIGVAIAGKYSKTTFGLVNPAKAYGDTLLMTWWRDANTVISSAGTSDDLTWSFRFKVDGTDGIERIGDAGGQYPSNTQQAAFTDPLWVGWSGGFWFEASPSGSTGGLSVQLIYLGPLD